ncbi:MAG: DoxX family protein [Bacteroidetes bacterium]|nr:DoxX family protein [Bacteroidota bacterium]
MKKYSVYLMALLYFLAGVNHFVHPDFYLKMLNGFLPYPIALNNISGAAEIILAIGICFSSTRKFSAYGIIALLIAIFPANINMALHATEWNFSAIALYVRLPIQLLLIWWAYVYTKE